MASALLILCAVLSACHTGPSSRAQRATIEELQEGDEILFPDQLGTVLQQSDARGAPTGSFAAFPFGVTRYDTSDTTRKYAGAPRDATVGLDHMGARFFSSELGVWTSPDPVLVESTKRAVGSAASAANAYAYAGQRPVVAKDEDGRWIHIAIGAGIGAIISGGVEAYHQYRETGHIDSWGRVWEKSGVGATAGAITALAGPQAGLATVAAVNAGAGIAQGLTDRFIDSGGKSVGCLGEAIGDGVAAGVTAGVMHGGAKLLTNVSNAFRRASTACFAAGTPVVTPDGLTPIEHVSEGTLVLSRDEVSGAMLWAPVANTYVYEGNETFELVLAPRSGAEESIRVTAEHPFWVDGRGWTSATELAAGDHLMAAGQDTFVQGKRAAASTVLVYNLEVAEAHTYFVGQSAVWVHNSCARPSVPSAASLTIAKGTHSEMLGQATSYLRSMSGTAQDKARAFEEAASQINKLSGGAWSAARIPSSDGSHIFAGELGEALVISPAGELFRGRFGTPGQFVLEQGGSWRPVFDALKGL